MTVFENCTVLLDLKNVPYKEKRKLRAAVTEHGGSLCLLVNKQCTFVVTSNVSKLSQLRHVQKHQTPVVGIDYVFSCVEKGALLPVGEHRLDINATESQAARKTTYVPPTHDVVTSRPPAKPFEQPVPIVKASQKDNDSEKFRTYTETDSDLPSFPDDFQVAKYSIFKMENSESWCVLELQSCSMGEGRRYRVVRYWKEDICTNDAGVKDIMVFLNTSEEAMECFKFLKDKQTESYLQLRSKLPQHDQLLGSAPLQELLLEDRLSTGQLSSEVAKFVNMLWGCALGRLSGFIAAPVEKLSLNDVNRAEGLLLRVHRQLKDGDSTEATALLEEVSNLLQSRLIIPKLKNVSGMLDLCQVLRDILNLNEVAVLGSPRFSLGKYRALRCSIEEVSPDLAEFRSVAALLDKDVQIHQVLRVCRGVELQTFKGDLGNVRPLLHASVPSNFVGILSRGLLLPHVGVQSYGVERTDAGNLGSGIYFSDAFRACLKYTKRHAADGSRLLLVCDVALGKSKDLHKRDQTLAQAPDGYHSVHGVRSTPSAASDFEDDEYVVYSPHQVKLKYVVLFNMEGDQKWDCLYTVDVDEVMSVNCPPTEEFLNEEDDLDIVPNPLDTVTAGLLDSSGQQLPLQAVHVKCKLMDLLSQVVIFQQYTNQRDAPIEAKYVFPLGECAAVCGFEAFINGKHVVGQVKEKETARKEYKKAIERGHGAYLMDQDAPDVFTISVGNLPPGATVLIKVTFVSELIVRDGSILFSLPGSVAPWQESAALNQTTQVSVEKVCVSDTESNQREFTLDASVEMPFEINSLNCITHEVKIKRTVCKAVVNVLPGQVLGLEGFQLSVSLSQAHLPRMWVENHPDKMSQACMLVFYPEFDLGPKSACEEVVILLDTSESMKGEPLRMAQRIAMQALQTLDADMRVNIVLFGTDYSEVFWVAQPLGDVHKEAAYAIRRLHPRGGSTELWRPLQALNLLPPSRGLRNLLLLSDGHIQNAAMTLQLVRDGVPHSRLFTCGLSSTANRHMLRALAEAGGGAFEFFDVKTRHNWAEKVASQVKRMATPGCSSVSVKWQQFSSDAPVPVQAPKQLTALFNDCHTLVFGFVPHCTQATLLGDLSGQELETIVSTTELQKTHGTFLHKLTARALIQDFEDGNLDPSEVEHEGKKAELKRYIVELSKEYSILSQFTSFVAVEERDSGEEDGVTDIPQLIADEDVDFLPYVGWPSTSPETYHSEVLQTDGFPFCDMQMDMCNSGSFDEASSVEYLDFEDEDMGLELNDMPSMHDSHFESVEATDFSFRSRGAPFLMSCTRVNAPPKQQNFGISPDSVSSPLSLRTDAAPSDAAEYLADDPVDLSPIRQSAQTVAGPTGPPEPFPSAVRGVAPSPLAYSCAPLPPSAFSADFCGAIDAISPVAATLFKALSCRAPPPPPPPATFGAAPPPPPPATFGAPPPPPPPPATFGAAPPPPPPATFGAPPPPPPPPATFGAATPSSPPPVVSGVAPSPPPATFGFAIPFSHHADPNAVPVSSSPGRAHRPVSIFPFESLSQPSSQSRLPAAHSDAPPSAGGAEHFSGVRAYASLRKRGFTDRAENVRHAIEGRAPREIFRLEDFALNASNEEAVPSRSWINKAAEVQEEDQVLRHRLLGLSPCSYRSARAFKSCRSLPVKQGVKKVAKDAGLQEPFQLDESTWRDIFTLQNLEDGYWEPSPELGELIKVDFGLLVDFLLRKGVRSLGENAKAVVIRLLATLLVLQFMRVNKLHEGQMLRTLFSLEEQTIFSTPRWFLVKRATDWARAVDRQYPSIYSRLEIGFNWESSTRQLLGYESIGSFSPLSGLNLQGAFSATADHEGLRFNTTISGNVNAQF